MRNSIDPKENLCQRLIYVKNMTKDLSSNYSQKFLDTTKKSATDALNRASKKAIQKEAQTTLNLIRNKIVDKITKNTLKDQINLKAIKQIEKNSSTSRSTTTNINAIKKEHEWLCQWNMQRK